jgi:hypothetical protein
MPSGLMFTLRDNFIFTRFEVLTAVRTIFWDVTPFNLVDTDVSEEPAASIFSSEVYFFEICAVF